MNKIFKDIEIGDEVFNYYYQVWGKMITGGTNKFVVSYTLDTGEAVRRLYDYDGSGWLSGYRAQEVFTEEIPPLPADDLSNLREGDKVFVQPYQKWAEVSEVLLIKRDITVKIPRDEEEKKDWFVTVTNTGLFSKDYKAPIVFLEEVPQPSEILTELTSLHEFL